MKSKCRKLTVLLLAAAMLFTFMPVTALAAGTDNPHPVGSTHGSGWTAWDGTATFPGGNVYLSNDITLSKTLKISSGTVNLCLNGKVLKISEDAMPGQAIEVAEGATLNLCDCRTTVHKFTPDESGKWVFDEENGTKSVNGGVITGGDANNGSAINSSGTLRIYGGNITGNYAGSRAVVYSSGTEFSMYGGSICGNSGDDGVSGVGLCLWNSRGKHQLRGGKIYGNTAVADDSPVGAGVSVTLGDLLISGNVEIYDNKRGTEKDNVYVVWNRNDDAFIVIDGEMTNAKPIGVWGRYEDVVIKADGTKVTDLTAFMDNFTPDNTGRVLQLTDDKMNIQLTSQPSEDDTRVLVESWDISATESDNVTAALYRNEAYTEETKLYDLKITGTGAMKDYSVAGTSNRPPWEKTYGDGIVNAEISEGVTNIGDALFVSSDITSIKISSTVTTIGNYAFYYCALTEITIPENVVLIESDAFSSSDLSKATILGKNCEIKNSNAYSHAFNNTSVVLFGYKDSTTQTYAQSRGFLFIPFCDENDITKEHVFAVGANSPCLSCGHSRMILDNVSCGDNLYATMYYTQTEDDTYSLTLNITGTGEMTSAPWSAYNKNIEVVTLSEGLTSIYKDAFENSKIQTIDIPSTVTVIGSDAFMKAAALTKVTGGENIEEIGSWAFYSASSLTEFSLGEKVKTIKSAAFNGTKITSYHLPASLETLEATSLGTYTTLTVDSNNPNYKAENNILYSKDGKKLLLYPSAATETEFEVPGEVEVIGERAFSNDYIKTVVLPDTVKTVEREAFYSSRNLSALIVLGENTELYDEMEGVSSSRTIIYGYAGSKAEAYCTEMTTDYVTYNFVPFCEGEHTYTNGLYCDVCKFPTEPKTEILSYENQTAEIHSATTGKYTVIFADYENNQLKNMDIVAFDFVVGSNTVPQSITSFTLGTGDKVILWSDMTKFVPLCDTFVIGR